MKKMFILSSFLFVSLAYAITVEQVTAEEFIRVLKDWRYDAEALEDTFQGMDDSDFEQVLEINRYRRANFKQEYSILTSPEFTIQDEAGYLFLVAKSDLGAAQGILLAKQSNVPHREAQYLKVEALLLAPWNILPCNNIYPTPIEGVEKALFEAAYTYAQTNHLGGLYRYAGEGECGDFYCNIILDHIPVASDENQIDDSFGGGRLYWDAE